MGLALDEPAEDDERREINGIDVAIEKQVLPHVENITLDVQTNSDGQSGLVMDGGSDSDCC
ncbi:hypothetical protein [Sinobaca sp. H24]|uniref:hypothetical protein n=1 Tax=Sinobaca sp. H24 TaxID=2923376 RepID=UPI00207AD629|nr:hypothetical protein [Sinobaca sp. H24]